MDMPRTWTTTPPSSSSWTWPPVLPRWRRSPTGCTSFPSFSGCRAAGGGLARIAGTVRPGCLTGPGRTNDDQDGGRRPVDLLRSHDEIDELSRRHAAWQLLRARTAPLVLTFLGGVFIEENNRSLPRSDLLTRLDELLHAVNEGADEGERYARTAAAYLDEWADPGTGWLRAYYPPGADEPAYDATPAVEKAL